VGEPRRSEYDVSTMRRNVEIDPDIAAIAALIGDPSRAAMLSALSDGRALPAGELARAARISAQTASAHLDKLFRRHLLAVEVQGRHHYYRLRDARVAELLESLAIVAAPAPALSAAQRDGSRALRFARTCYGHLAGRLGVELTRALCRSGTLREDETAYRVTRIGEGRLRALGIEVGALTRRPLTRRCLDWSERRHHLAGSLGVALAHRLIELGWLSRTRQSRALRITDRGAAALRSEFGLEI
jgi:DNA-binding transcriptional ArsR family regulator